MTASARVQAWQRRKQAAGLCRACGREPLADNRFCAACREKSRTQARNYQRRKAGKPLDAPVAKTGRPAGRLTKAESDAILKRALTLRRERTD